MPVVRHCLARNARQLTGGCSSRCKVLTPSVPPTNILVPTHLAQGIVDLVGAGVVQVLALQVDFGAGAVGPAHTTPISVHVSPMLFRQCAGRLRGGSRTAC